MRSFICLLFALACVAVPAFGQYHIEAYDTELTLLPNGTYAVNESITFVFDDGTFSQGHRRIPLRGVDGINNVEVRSPDAELYDIEHDGSSRAYVLTWRYPERGEPITFDISYELAGSLIEDGDENRIEWMALGDEWEASIHQFTARVSLPPFSMDREELSVTPEAYSDVEQSAAGWLISFTHEDIDPNTSFGIEVSFPRQLDGREPPSSGWTLFFSIVAGLLLGVVPAAWSLSRRNGPPHVRERAALPPEVSLADAFHLIRTSTSFSHTAFRAMLINLAQRGHLTLHQATRTSWGAEQEVVEVETHPKESELSDLELEFLKRLEKREILSSFDTNEGIFQWKALRDVQRAGVDEGYWIDRTARSNRFYMLGFAALIVAISSIFMFDGSDAAFAAALFGGTAIGMVILGIERYELMEKGARCKEQIEGYLSELRTTIERDLERAPTSAIRAFLDHLPWLVLDPKADYNWMQEVEEAIEEYGAELSLPTWFTESVSEEDEEVFAACFLPFIIASTTGGARSSTGIQGSTGGSIGATGGVGGGGGGVS